MALKIGLTGGIGSGKSTVCRLLELLGVPCYNSDRAAKRLMWEKLEVRKAMTQLLGPECYHKEALNAPYVSSKIFENTTLLEQVNRIVHPAVSYDFSLWAQTQSTHYVVEESAILFESGADRNMDKVVVVIAPEELRIGRVIRREGLTRQAVQERIKRQLSDPERVARADYLLYADDRQLLIPQVVALHHQLLQL